jgi:hypothetical protein
VPKTKCMYMDGYGGQGCERRGCMLDGEMVEVVNEFKYLGLQFNKRFDMCSMANARLVKGK